MKHFSTFRILSLFLLLCTVQCKEKDISEVLDYDIQIKDYFLFEEGSVWTYQDDDGNLMEIELLEIQESLEPSKVVGAAWLERKEIFLDRTNQMVYNRVYTEVLGPEDRYTLKVASPVDYFYSNTHLMQSAPDDPSYTVINEGLGVATGNPEQQEIIVNHFTPDTAAHAYARNIGLIGFRKDSTNWQLISFEGTPQID